MSNAFWMEHWLRLLDHLRLIGKRTSISITQAKMMFMWSKVVSDMCVT